MYLISVYFDEKSNKILQSYIDKIADKSGNTFMLDNSVPPHITISSIEAKNIDVLLPAFNLLEGKLKAGKIQFCSVGQLLPYVIFAMPVLDAYLQDMMKEIYGAYKDIPDTNISRLYRPNSWVAHTTLGKTLDKEQMLLAFEVMQKNFVPFEVSVTEIGLAKVNPHEDIKRFKLINEEGYHG